MTKENNTNLQLTVDEIIATLQRTSLTTVLVEGTDDVMIYRWIEDEIGITKANFMPCGGRRNLIEIFERRSEYPNVKVIYVADKDSYIYTSTPEEYNEIIWTNGYSIENDLYFGRNIESILSKEEKDIFVKSLDSFIEYYSFEVEKMLSGSKDFTLRNHPQHIICEIQHIVKQEYLDSINFKSASTEIIQNIKTNYDVMIRGKSLFALLTRIVSNKNREIKHSKPSLLEHCYRTHRSEKFNELLVKINQKISA
ncbi:DUF4435 domain-containing protein [Flavobacterium branchiophilum]|uniref:Uncharacterized protein n=1 Tax=Flavobacterium branchiophilum TaxID=55197 RepID=A0A2H3KN68_9FLAO|nr:DUF4435 domain-containing protein [Flavobacterium branchiophilum]PDS22184.1 hypothetical protein B0A77_13995 [Flavobacterium branchiophilum]